VARYCVNPQRVIEMVRRIHFPRETGSAGEQSAFEVIAGELDALGLEPSYEPFEAPWFDCRPGFIEAAGRRVPVTPLVNPVYDGEWLAAPAHLDIEGQLTDEAHPSGAPGAIVIRSGYDRRRPFVAGARAQLFIGRPPGDYIAYFRACDNRVPAAWIRDSASDVLRRNTGSVCRLLWGSKQVSAPFKNMVVEVAGPQSTGSVAIAGAHIDSFTGTVGACDNAYGAAFLVELARWYAQRPPQTTVRLIWFTGEELDRRGSGHYVTEHLAEADGVLLYVNVDSGVSHEHGDPYVAVTGPDVVLAALHRHVASLGPAIAVHHRGVGACDTAPFEQAGVPTAFVAARLNSPPPHPHLPSDTVDTLSTAKIQRNGALSLALLDAAQSGALCGKTGPTA